MTGQLDSDRLYDALVEIDTYLANDPQVWRIVSVAKAGDVLCDVLGAEVVQRINRGVAANLCVACQAASAREPEKLLGDGEPLRRDERAELELLRDNQRRLIGFDGGAELMSWLDVHKLHGKDPYIGCPFCRERFGLRELPRDGERPTEEMIERVRDWLDTFVEDIGATGRQLERRDAMAGAETAEAREWALRRALDRTRAWASHYKDESRSQQRGTMRLIHDEAVAALAAASPASREESWRAQVLVVQVGTRSGLFLIEVPAAQHGRRVWISAKDLPEEIRAVLRPGFRLFARVNLGAKRTEDLRFSEWELPVVDDAPAARETTS